MNMVDCQVTQTLNQILIKIKNIKRYLGFKASLLNYLVHLDEVVVCKDKDGHMMMIFGIVGFSLIFLSFYIYAGIGVMKELFFVSAEISLLIFIAQSYCDVSIRTSSGNDALKSIMILGSVYILYRFFDDLYKTLKKNLADVPKKFVSWEKVLIYIFYAFFTIVFVYAPYLVVYLTVMDLCVYKS